MGQRRRRSKVKNSKIRVGWFPVGHAVPELSWRAYDQQLPCLTDLTALPCSYHRAVGSRTALYDRPAAMPNIAGSLENLTMPI